MRFWIWFWAVLSVSMVIIMSITLINAKGYEKNSYPMYGAIVVSLLMWRWAHYQHKKWKLRKKYKLKTEEEQQDSVDSLPDNA